MLVTWVTSTEFLSFFLVSLFIFINNMYEVSVCVGPTLTVFKFMKNKLNVFFKLMY